MRKIDTVQKIPTELKISVKNTKISLRTTTITTRSQLTPPLSLPTKQQSQIITTIIMRITTVATLKHQKQLQQQRKAKY